MLTKDGLELSLATQLARKNLGDLDVTVSIDGFVDLVRLAIKGLDSPPPYVSSEVSEPETPAEIQKAIFVHQAAIERLYSKLIGDPRKSVSSPPISISGDSK